MASTISPISQSTLADLVATRLRQAIIAGELGPGERLTEPSVAEWMGISRSPVREALRRLEAMGLARRRTNYSACVWEPTEVDVDEIMSLRLMIEQYAASTVIHTLTATDLAQLRAIITLQEQAIRDQAYLELVRTDREFHEYMVRKARNSRLMEWWDQIMSQWEVLVVRRWHYDPEKVIPRVLRDHEAILGALQQANLAALLSLHREINTEVCEETKKMLRVDAAQGRRIRVPAEAQAALSRGS